MKCHIARWNDYQICIYKNWFPMPQKMKKLLAPKWQQIQETFRANILIRFLVKIIRINIQLSRWILFLRMRDKKILQNNNWRWILSTILKISLIFWNLSLLVSILTKWFLLSCDFFSNKQLGNLESRRVYELKVIDFISGFFFLPCLLFI